MEMLGDEDTVMRRAYEHSFIHGIHVATPCHESWERMTGDDKSRFCDSCKLNVYNISSMSLEEAEQLIIAKEGKLCVRFYRRSDGTILTKDCPKGLKLVRDRLLRTVAACATLLTVGVSYLVSLANRESERQETAIRKMQVLVKEAQHNVRPVPAVAGMMLMGAPPPPAELGKLVAKGNK